MKCQKVRKKSSAFVDGELSEKKKVEIIRHLETCPSCEEEVKVLSSLSVLLREEKESIKASPYFWSKLEQRIIQAETNENVFDALLWWLNRTLVPASATAVVVIGLFIGIGLGGIIHTRIAPILNPDNSSFVQQEMNQSLYLSALNDFPQESLGEIYIGLLSENSLPK